MNNIGLCEIIPENKLVCMYTHMSDWNAMQGIQELVHSYGPQ